jgi:hypothetical protein
MSYIYTFIRKDISTAQKIVQIGHACFEAGKRFKEPHGISSLILLGAEDEDDLKSIARKLDERGIDFYMFYEPDNSMGYSAICTKPITEGRDRTFFRKWNLFKHTD